MNERVTKGLMGRGREKGRLRSSWGGLVLLGLVLGCGDQRGGGATQPAEAAVSDSASKSASESAGPSSLSEAPSERALAAKDALFQQLSQRLVSAMSAGGPARAIEVCSREARSIADEVGERHGVRIGRTASRLRNPQNLPPEWAKESLLGEPQERVHVTLEAGGDGFLFPIFLKVQCLACHGPREQIAPAVLDELHRLYPEDQATGFEEGALRGWFWVEVGR